MSLFVLDLTYIANIDDVDRHIEAHREFLKRHYADGTFLASGRKEPRTGGVILASGERSEIEKIITRDPFHAEGVARYAITEFHPSITGQALAAYAE